MGRRPSDVSTLPMGTVSWACRHIPSSCQEKLLPGLGKAHMGKTGGGRRNTHVHV